MGSIFPLTPIKVRKGYDPLFRLIGYYREHSNKAEARTDIGQYLLTNLRRKTIFDKGLPRIVFPATRWLKSHIRHHMEVFEWGSGASTIFFSKYVKKLVSVEHDARWFDIVKKRIEAEGRHNVDLLYVPPSERDNLLTKSKGEKKRIYGSFSPQFRERLFCRYVESILAFPDEKFDIVMIDGRARFGCLTFARSKVRENGMIILDDSERMEYAQAIELLKTPQWRPMHFEGPGPTRIWPGFWRTTFFFREKPNNTDNNAL